MQTRVYVPLSVAQVRALSRDGKLDAGRSGPLAGYAVTTGLRQGNPGWDEEDLEYLAFVDAATTGTTTAGSPRVVLAADVEEDDLVEVTSRETGAPGDTADSADSADGAGLTAVLVTAPLPVRRVVSLHVEDRAGAPPAPDEVADFLWYDVTELETVVDALA